jgi:hypothetical protein
MARGRRKRRDKLLADALALRFGWLADEVVRLYGELAREGLADHPGSTEYHRVVTMWFAEVAESDFIKGRLYHFINRKA